MSNTTISPTVAALAAAGIAVAALAVNLPTSAPQQAVTLAGNVPTVTSVNAVSPRGGLPASWSNLGANAAGAAVGPLRWTQARLQVSGTLAGASVVIQGSNDGSTWFDVAGVNDLNSRGFKIYQSDGLHIRTPEPGTLGFGENPNPTAPPLPGGLIVLSLTNPSAGFPYLRPIIYGGNGSTSVNVAGNINPNGAV